MSDTLPVVWTIAGSDSSGCAGLQADLKTLASFGVHGATIVTAATAQGAGTFKAAGVLPEAMVRAQIDAVATDLTPRAVKLGMLGGAGAVRAVAEFLRRTDAFVVLDPVLGSTSGGALLDEEGKRALVRELLPRVDLITPNLDEAKALTGGSTAEECARRLRESGAKRVLVKGGHEGDGDLRPGTEPFCEIIDHSTRGVCPGTEVSVPLVTDHYFDGQGALYLSSPRLPFSARGTGCALASAVAAAVARGHDVDDALVLARAYVARGIRLSSPANPDKLVMVSSTRVLHHAPSAPTADDLPWLTPTRALATDRPSFPPVGPEPLGFYPVVDRTAWLARLLPLGVRTIQLRIKDLTGDALRRELAEGIVLARAHGARLFVNDYWRLAVELGAYGVHLGQEDLADADVHAIARAGLRLGVSTHSYAEAAAAHALRPSYVALGPIFETTCKSMRFGPQGLARIAEWKDLLPYPLVAIGGLKAEHAREARVLGADGVAVVSDVTRAADPESRARQWLEATS